MSDVRACSEERDEDRSKFRVFVSELEGKSGEDVVKVLAVLEIARTEEGSAQPSVGEDAFRDGLGDCGLASPGEPVQPVDGGSIGVLGPRLDVIQDSVPGPFETTLAIAMSELGPSGTTTIVQHR